MSRRFSRSRRARTSTVSSTSCFTAVVSVARLDAMKSASRPGSVMFIASACRSSDSSGDSETTCWKLVLMFRWSASISRRSSSRIVSSAGFTRARRYGRDGRDRVQLQPRQPLDDQAQAAIGQLEHLVDVRGGADPVEIVLGRLLDRRIALREHADELAAADRLFDRAARSFRGRRPAAETNSETTPCRAAAESAARSGSRPGARRTRRRCRDVRLHDSW